jgi:hypothetical protein
LLFCPELLRDSSFSVLFFNYRSFRPRSLISPAARDRWKDVPNPFGRAENSQIEMNDNLKGGTRSPNALLFGAEGAFFVTSR